ncbi:polysaccharide deacetylase [Paenibacillus lutrae]|uniref:Polysaccharide deacetylase family protein n=1 Tax=Paenibacillus lutrae TaxID=2078573 RepID=A0A7X3FHI3_9BACL|nr:polysaccharide deacetylase [Paenibacillus lutrae]MVO99740.1 polysaccharide deacetylase family protein [Paenibacillus lutrae]
MLTRSPVVRFTRFVLLVLLLSALHPFLQLEPAVHAASRDDHSSSETYGELKSGRITRADQPYKTADTPTVYLTFDDGPSRYTPQVLEILRKEGISATFFVVGEQVQAHPELAGQLVREGHAIGNHSFDHTYKNLYKDFNEFWEQVQQTDQAIERAAGIRTRLFRAPGGTAQNFDAFYFYYMNQAGFTVFDWDVDSNDSKRTGVPEAEIIRSIKKAPLKKELNLLFHDGIGHEETVKALPEIIRYFKSKGYAFAKLDEQVKPAQFPVRTAERWDRTIPEEEEFISNVEAVQAWANPDTPGDRGVPGTAYEQGAGKSEGEAGGVRIATAGEHSLPLLLNVNRQVRRLASDQVLYPEQRLEVPLRVLAEEMGAKVVWSPGTRTASVSYGYTRLDYSLSTFTLTVNRWGRQVEVYSLPDTHLIEGTLYVPLLQTAEVLGVAVEEHRSDAAGHYITLSTKGFYFLLF